MEMVIVSRNKPYLNDTRHLFKRFRIDGIKAILRGISGGNQNNIYLFE